MDGRWRLVDTVQATRRQRRYSQYPRMYHLHARTAMQENVGYKRPRREQK